MHNDIEFHQQQHLGIITLNRKQYLNALTLSMIQELQTQLSKWSIDDSVYAVIIKSNHDKVFCVGGDIRWLYNANFAEQMQFFQNEYQLNHYIYTYPKPYIALLDGITMGGGVGIALHGSHPIASENFVFAMPETNIGFFPDIGASYLLTRCIGEVGTYLGLSGNRLNVSEAKSCGLIKYVINKNDFDLLIQQLLLTDLSVGAYQKVDACIEKLSTVNYITTMNYDLNVINHCFKYNDMQQIYSGLENIVSGWSNDIKLKLLKKSPLSLMITLQKLRKSKDIDLKSCLMMDYILVQHFMRGTDFYEGVRALLIDKDNLPQWQKLTDDDLVVLDYFKEDTTELLEF